MDEDRAVITLQIGHYSNFVGAHFWNIQEAGFVYASSTNPTFVPEINHGVLFREGVTGYGRTDGQTTFTPRLVSVDLKGALGRYYLETASKYFFALLLFCKNGANIRKYIGVGWGAGGVLPK